jgi:hypothetical protein
MFRFICAFEAFRVSSGCHGRWQRVPRCLIGVPTRRGSSIVVNRWLEECIKYRNGTSRAMEPSSHHRKLGEYDAELETQNCLHTGQDEHQQSATPLGVVFTSIRTSIPTATKSRETTRNQSNHIIVCSEVVFGACGSRGNHLFRSVFLVVEALLVALLGGTSKPATCSERVQVPLALVCPLGKQTIHVRFCLETVLGARGLLYSVFLCSASHVPTGDRRGLLHGQACCTECWTAL